MSRHFQFAPKSLEVFIPLMQKSPRGQCSYCKQTDLTSKNCFAKRKKQVCKVEYYCLKLRVESTVSFRPGGQRKTETSWVGS